MSAPDMDLKGVTQDEISKLTKAMKSQEFRGHMDEYCREVSDPANRKEYMQYLDQLEAKGEMPEGQQLLRCQPGCCVKTWVCFKNGQTQKCFINIVHSDRLDDVQMERSDKGEGHQVKLPYSLSPPRPDRDLKGEYCMTCDFAVSSRTFFQAMQYPNYMKMLVDTAAENLAAHHLKGNEEVKKDYKVMQKMACKGGVPMPMSVKAEMLRDKGAKPTTPKVKAGADAVTPSELRQMRKEAKDKKSREEQEEEEEEKRIAQARAPAPEKVAAAPRIRVPQHRLVHSGLLDLTDYMESSNQHATAPPSIPKLLKLTVEVPTVKRVGDINLEVTSVNVVVEVPEKYYLDLPLPYEVQETRGSAKFDKAKQVLTLELPVVPKLQTPNPNFSWRDDEPAAGGDDGALSEGNADTDEDMPALEEAEQPAVQPPAAVEPAPAATATREPPAPAPAADAAAPPRQLLEFDAQGGSLNIARPGEEGEDAVAEAEMGDGSEEYPPFVAAEAFEGARPGYYFGQGDEGLGYYRDKRQPRPGRSRPSREVRIPGAPGTGPQPAPAASPAEPLVAEIADRPAAGGAAGAGGGAAASAAAKAEETAEPTRQLPASLQKYVDATSALASRPASASGAKACEEPAVEWEQSLQNLMLFVELPSGHEVADLQLAVRSQRLTLAFCSRAAAGEPWRRWQLRRLLCGMVDPRQWHAEPPASAGEPLVVVIRKVDRGLWPHIYDAKASTIPEPSEIFRSGSASATAVEGGDAAAAGVEGSTSLNDLDSDPAPAGVEGIAEAEDAPVEDSAELDAVAPVTDEAAGVGAKAVAEGGGHGGGAPKGPATEAMIQSAVVMGQGVLIRNRLVYELL